MGWLYTLKRELSIKNDFPSTENGSRHLKELHTFSLKGLSEKTTYGKRSVSFEKNNLKECLL